MTENDWSDLSEDAIRLLVLKIKDRIVNVGQDGDIAKEIEDEIKTIREMEKEGDSGAEHSGVGEVEIEGVGF